MLKVGECKWKITGYLLYYFLQFFCKFEKFEKKKNTFKNNDQAVILEIVNTEIIYSVDVFNSTVDTAEKKISELEEIKKLPTM